MTGKYGIKFADIIDLCIFLIPISIICARLYYVLFELKTKTTHIGNCLYAIRISETGSTKMYDLIQFRKSDTVKYVFEY